MTKSLDAKLRLAKQASSAVSALSASTKKQVLVAIAQELETHKKKIFEANAKDVKNAKNAGKSAAFLDRLTLSPSGFKGMIEQLQIVANLPDVSGEVIEKKLLKNGIHLKKVRFPIGVIAMIYESRPNVTIDVAGLCIKSGNAVILKGGSEAAQTNKLLVDRMHTVFKRFKLPSSVVTFLENITHEQVEELLKRSDLIDVVIPRGSYALTSAVAEKSRIPILYHASGGARMYVDKSADIEQSLAICLNAKTNRTGVCNALDTVLVHEKIAEAFLTKLDPRLYALGFVARADERAMRYMKHAEKAVKEDFSTEFLDNILAVKVVKDAKEAIDFIKSHTNGHTEVLASKDQEVTDAFIREIDAAGLMINCSSRLHDGGEFEMGAEMGTATGKLHARGPVGVRELTTYKWIAYGNGQLKT